MRSELLRRVVAIVLPACVPLVTACDDPLLDPALLDDPRVIAVQLAVPDSGGRAQPLPGEQFDVRVFVPAAKPRDAHVAVRACVAEPTTLGVPRCASEPFDGAIAVGTTTEPVELQLTLDRALPPNVEWVLQGAVCWDGEPVYSVRSQSFGCGVGEPKEFFLRTTIASGDLNKNPDLTDDELRYDGSLWQMALDAPAPGESCAQTMVPQVRVGQRIDIEFRMMGEDRESLSVDPGEYGALEREGLVFSHMVTLPGLERPFSSTTALEDSTSFALEFVLDDEISLPDEGRAAVFYMVARDDRGGCDVLSRVLCAVP